LTILVCCSCSMVHFLTQLVTTCSKVMSDESHFEF
jgi:hypothetical protein